MMSKIKLWFKRLFKLFFRMFLFFSIIGLFVFLCNYRIIKSTEKHLYSDIKSIPKNKVGLLLGTNPRVANGKRKNIYFSYRIDAAARLFKAGKIDYILASGDNHIKSYDEPEAMKQALMKKGVPAKNIYLDYAGFRTLDSVIRCEKVFGESKFTVISQPFHNQRAVYIARQAGMAAVGFNAKKVRSRRWTLRVKARELLAKVKAIIDVHITKKEPKFLGKPHKIG